MQPDSSLSWRYGINPLTHPQCRCSTLSHELVSLTQRQFVQSLSNPYYLHHLCILKYFEDDAFVEWCKYLKYFSESQYLPYLSYVASCPVLVENLICAS